MSTVSIFIKPLAVLLEALSSVPCALPTLARLVQRWVQFQGWRVTSLTVLFKTGLRQIATARYSFGFYGAKLCSVLNVIINAGFAVVNVVVCGQILSAVSDYTMTIAVGCVIVAVISYLVSVFGFAIIHTYEKYSWIMSFILRCILVGQATPHITPNAPPFDSGLSLAGGILSFLTLNFAAASS